ncbi:MAG: autotransporter domain-containing protein [bacterium]|nr:autotransporter domain-containing protein [bacterium]
MGTLISVIILATLSSDSHAIEQFPHKREGFFVGAGLGFGSAGADVTVVQELTRQNGGTGNVRMGWAIRDNLVAGVEFTGFAAFFSQQATDDLRWVLTLSSLAVTWWPGNMGLYVRGGAGIATSRVEVVTTGAQRQDNAGAGVLLATGYEWRLMENMAIGPQAEYVYMKIDGDLTKNANYVSFSLQLTGYW